MTSYTYNDDGNRARRHVLRARSRDALRPDGPHGCEDLQLRNGWIPSGATGDDDNYVRYVFAKGLQTQMWVDLDGDNVQDADDQVTTYTYGTPKGNRVVDSNLATGPLIRRPTPTPPAAPTW